MDESAENIATAKVVERHRGRRVRWRIIGRAKTHTAIASTLVVVPNEARQHSSSWRRLATSTTSRWSRHSRRTVPTHRSANALATGVRAGVRMIRAPIERQTSSKAPPNFES